MLQILQNTRIPFMRYRKFAYMLSGAIIAVGLISVAMHGGFRLGVDFTGGRLMEYRFSQPLQTDHLRQVVDKLGIQGAEIQSIGEGNQDFLIRLPVEEEKLASVSPSATILQSVLAANPGMQGELRREELVGPRVGRELRGKAVLAVIIALAGIFLYVGIRYEFTFAAGGVISLAHDVLVTLLMFSVFNKEITISVVAALLTIGGYSINDTVVVFDRIREQGKLFSKRSLQDVMDLGVNSTLSRTLITSATVFYTVAALFFLGGEVIHDFAFAMLWGVGFGTYSSVYVASALALEFGKGRAEKAKTAKAA